MANFAVVGQSVYRKDANPKVTGRALYVGNIEMPGMLHVAVLRSPYPHARIARIDKSKAEALSGVAVVVTGAEIAKMPGIDPHFGPAFRDQPILAVEKVCYVGDPVVAVAAVDKRTAEDALQLVEVDYDPLPAVLDVLDAVKPNNRRWSTNSTGRPKRSPIWLMSKPANSPIFAISLNFAWATSIRPSPKPTGCSKISSLRRRRSMCRWSRMSRWSISTSMNG